MEFTATIYREGVNFLVEVPEEISKGFDEKGYIYVKGTANGYSFYSTLVPRGGGCHKLFLKGEIRKAAKVGEGDEVQLTLKEILLQGNSLFLLTLMIRWHPTLKPVKNFIN